MHSATFILMSSLSLLQDFVFRPASQSSKAWNFETSGRNRRNLSLGFWPFSSISFLKPLISFNSIMKFGGKDIACKHVLWISERGIHTAAVVPLAAHRERERERHRQRDREERQGKGREKGSERKNDGIERLQDQNSKLLFTHPTQLFQPLRRQSPQDRLQSF